MRYALWSLHFENELGTGPEEKAYEFGGRLEAGPANDEVQNGGRILGYIIEDFGDADLSVWQFQEITESEALDFALQLNETAHISSNGRIDFN